MKSLYDIGRDHNDDRADRFARQLSRRSARWLITLTIFLLCSGLAIAVYHDEPATAARTGSLLTGLALAHGYYALRYDRILIPARSLAIEVRMAIERDRNPHIDELEAKVRAERLADRLLPKLFGGVAKRLAAQNLAVAAVGTFVWGFADLLPISYFHSVIFP